MENIKINILSIHEFNSLCLISFHELYIKLPRKALIDKFGKRKPPSLEIWGKCLQIQWMEVVISISKLLVTGMPRKIALPIVSPNPQPAALKNQPVPLGQHHHQTCLMMMRHHHRHRQLAHHRRLVIKSYHSFP